MHVLHLKMAALKMALKMAAAGDLGTSDSDEETLMTSSSHGSATPNNRIPSLQVSPQQRQCHIGDGAASAAPTAMRQQVQDHGSRSRAFVAF